MGKGRVNVTGHGVLNTVPGLGELLRRFAGGDGSLGSGTVPVLLGPAELSSLGENKSSRLSSSVSGRGGEPLGARI